MPKASAILVSDIHIREDQPVCRTDDFLQTQKKKLQFLQNLQKTQNCMVVHAGDLFHHWKPSPFLLSFALAYLPDNFHTIYGQHDLPQHNIKLANKTGINTLATAGKIHILSGGHWGTKHDPDNDGLQFPKTGRHILVLHQFVRPDNTTPWPGCIAPTATDVLKQYPEYDLIVTGDNHTSFTQTLDGRVLVNPGAITRQEADKSDAVPMVYLWYEEDNSLRAVTLPHEKNVITREHLEYKEERDIRIQAFIERLNVGWTAQLSFEANLDQFELGNKVRASVMQIVRKACEREA